MTAIVLAIQRPLGRRGNAGHARIWRNGHAQGAAKGLENRFRLVVGIFTPQVIDVQGHAGVVNQALEKFAEQIDIKGTDHGAGEINVVFKPRPTGKVDDNARQSFIERDVAVPVAGQALLVPPGLGKRLTKGDTEVFDGVMGVDMQIAMSNDIEVDEAMAGNLVQHVVEERNTGGELALAGAIKVETHGNLRFEGIA